MARDSIMKYCFEVLSNGASIRSLNHTLIPKIKDSKLVDNYRPISLCNIVYKLIFKIITNRLKSCLDNLISSK